MFGRSALQRNATDNHAKYRLLSNISAGAHGLVLKACLATSQSSTSNRTDDRQMFAIKRIFVQKQKPEHLQLVREIKSLQLLRDQTFVSSG